MALLLSHQIVASVVASRTMNLSLAERPVCCPVVTCKRPVGGNLAFAALDRCLVKLRHSLIVEGVGTDDAGGLDGLIGIEGTRL